MVTGANEAGGMTVPVLAEIAMAAAEETGTLPTWRAEGLDNLANPTEAGENRKTE